MPTDALRPDDHEAAITIEQWAEANGYDLRRRRYRKARTVASAQPGVHCGTHYPDEAA